MAGGVLKGSGHIRGFGGRTHHGGREDVDGNVLVLV